MEKLIEKWEDILLLVKNEHEITDVSYNVWLKPLSVYSVENQKVYILVPDEQMGVAYITKKYLLPLRVAIAEVTGIEYEIEFILPEQTKKVQPYKAKNINSEGNSATNGLNPNYTFDTFVVGDKNRFTYSASLAVAESPGEVYNPLFIWGGVGLGKTHLMHSIAHFIQDNNPNMKVLYVTSEVFTNEVIDSIRNKNNASMNNFREKYRNTDVLLIDDIQFIIGKESTQEEFFHTFNELHMANKAIIISSDKPPKDMETLEERIKSRFEQGLITDIGSPDYETRMAILRRKKDMDNIELDDEILDYIATNIKSNIRELEGALNRLLAYSNLENKEITLDIAKEQLQSVIYPNHTKEITPELIIDVVCEHFNITNEQIISSRRTNDIARPRQIAMYLCKVLTEASLDKVGSLLGGRDHSTIIHGINKIDNEYRSSTSTKNLIDTIKKKINPN